MPGPTGGEAIHVRLDPLLAFAIAAMWLAAGALAAALCHARTAAGLRRRARLLLAVVAAAGGASLLLTTPLLTAAAAIALGFAVPRLVRLYRVTSGFAAAGPGVPAPPALRAAAAHPAVVVAVQAMAYASAAAPLLTSALSAVLAPALVLAFGLTLHGYAARHRGLAAGALFSGAHAVSVVAARSYRGVAATAVRAG